MDESPPDIDSIMDKYKSHFRASVQLLNVPEEEFDQSITLAIEGVARWPALSTHSERVALFDRLEKVYPIYMQMLNNLEKYSVFYSDLREHLSKLQNAIDFFCSGRSQERLKLEKHLKSNTFSFSVSTFYSRRTDSTSFSFPSLVIAFLFKYFF